MRSLAVDAMAVRSMRNLSHVDVVFSRRFNVVGGDNGQGKTNLLEALYVVASSKSFRSAKPGDLLQHGVDIASVRAGIVEGDDALRSQSVGVRRGGRLALIDEKRPSTLAAYAVRTPVVVFHPGAAALSTGGGSERRRLLDRIALYLAPGSLSECESYSRALRERQKALEARGVNARDLDDWEELLVRHGSELSSARALGAGPLADAAVRAFARIGTPRSELRAEYARSAPPEREEYRRELQRRRAPDLRRGSAAVGPHRDDLSITLDGHDVRGVASQGQHRAVVLALKLAEVGVVGEARGVHPILLLDDVSSELDRARTGALFAFLREQQGQVFLTTTRPELIDTGALLDLGARRDFIVEGGVVRVVAG